MLQLHSTGGRLLSIYWQRFLFVGSMPPCQTYENWLCIRDVYGKCISLCCISHSYFLKSYHIIMIIYPNGFVLCHFLLSKHTKHDSHLQLVLLIYLVNLTTTPGMCDCPNECQEEEFSMTFSSGKFPNAFYHNSALKKFGIKEYVHLF